MTIWVDGDSCAREVMNALLGCVRKRGFHIHVVADRLIPGAQARGVFTSIVGAKEGTADDFIFSRARSGDIAITRDFTLGIRLMKNGVAVMNDSGKVWKLKELEARAEEAELMLAIRRGGIARKPLRRYDPKAGSNFESSLLELIDSMHLPLLPKKL